MYDFSERTYQQNKQSRKIPKKTSAQNVPACSSPSNDRRIFQKKRKVVYKEGPSIENALVWDKRQKKYFKQMRPMDNSLEYITGRQAGTITGGVNEPGSQYNPDTNQYVDNPAKDPIGLNEILLEFDEGHFVEANTRNMQVYDGGEEIPKETEPFAIRLYAEGNMDHARGLSAGMEEYLHYAAPDSVLPVEKMLGRKVLIKASEFRSLADVANAYHSGGVPPDGLFAHDLTQWHKEALRTQLEGNGNLEGSFGGRTGDMTRDVPEGEHRLYDLIQTTFFWLQGYKQDAINDVRERANTQVKERNAQILELQKGMGQLSKAEKAIRKSQIDSLSRQVQGIKSDAIERCGAYYREGNEASYQMMIAFVRNQLRKLKPDGEIRIVVSNISPYAEIGERLTPEAIAAGEPDNPLYQNIGIEVRELGQTYPRQLAEEGLNSAGFEQRQTNKMSTVTGRTSGSHIDRDLIIIVHKRSGE